MKIISWNVNGIRAILSKGFVDFITQYNPDIICLQETKAAPEQVDLDLPEYPHKYWNAAQKKGYSGTAIFCKQKPLRAANDMDISKHDSEGRVITLEFNKFFLVNVYTPNSQRTLDKLSYRENEWDPDFLKFVKSLEKEKPVIFCGDLNVAHTEIDLARPANNRKNAGFTDQERKGFDNIINAGFIDAFREFHKEGGHYSWWSYMAQARENNIGWRIDYFCISQVLRPQLVDSYILSDVMGSDHAPVVIEIK